MLYDYQCNYCEHILEDVYQKVDEEPLVTCPCCNEDGLARIITGGAYAFVKNTNTIGGIGDKNAKANKSQIQEYQHKKAEAAPKEDKPWYKQGGATKGEINQMTKQQKAKYIMEGKK